MIQQEKQDYFNKVTYAFTPLCTPDVSAYIAAIFCHYSRFGSSYLATKYNNHFNELYPRLRPTVSIAPTSQGFAAYESFDLCIMDFVMLLMRERFSRLDLTHVELFEKRALACGLICRADVEIINLIYSQFNSNHYATKQ